MTIHIPPDYNQLMPYLILNDAAGFIDFAINILGAREKMMHRHEDGSLMHAELFFGESVVMIGGASEQWGVNNAGMFLYVADADESYKKAVDAGANSIMPPADQPYGRSCGVKDGWGNVWWITSVKEG